MAAWRLIRILGLTSSHTEDQGMSGPTSWAISRRTDDKATIDAIRRDLAERLTDPCMTEQDRFVLRQFAKFLSGVAPDPRPARLSDRLPGLRRVEAAGPASLSMRPVMPVRP